jgi:two-component system NtrC family sensor kinase
MGLLVIGFTSDTPTPPRGDDIAELAEAFGLALEMFQVRRRDELQRDGHELFEECRSTFAATLDASAGLDVFGRGAKRLLGAERATVWIYDRRARQLVLEASTDASHLSRGFRVSADDPVMPAAAAMGRSGAEISTSNAVGSLTIPLRGWRRALGAIVIDGISYRNGSEADILELADDLGRQLSNAIESLQLLQTMIDAAARNQRSSDGWLSDGERREMRRRAAQSDRLPALGVFVAGIAHELNNPLQGVLGHLELLRATGAFPRHLRQEVQTIYREADRAAKIVRNLLVFAGSRRLSRRQVSLNAVLQRVVTLRQTACRALDIEIVRNYDDKLPRVQSDPLLLHQVFLNIIMNAEQAIAAMGRPGRIEISTGVAASDDRVIATVRDSGDGIPADELTRIFEPFYTTKEVGKGTGLGLAIAYGIVREHGGDISATNAPGGGALFTVELPAIPARGRQG